MVVSGSRALTAGLAASLALALSACAAGPRARTVPVPDAVVERVPVGEWPLLVDDLDPGSFAEACGYSTSYLKELPAETVFSFGGEKRTAAQLAAGVSRLCEIALNEPDLERRTEILRREFVLLRSVGRDGHGDVLFTGYYEPLVAARRRPEPPFEHPVYGVPDDLLTVNLEAFGLEPASPTLVGRVEGRQVVPYAEREEIDFENGLRAPVPVLGYLADLVDVFFLQVQGSGTLIFPDGTRIRAGYARSNGRPYRSIGKLLLDEDVVSREEMSMQAIRSYLADNPQELRRVLSYNPSYVFFRPLEASGGPLGCYQLPVTAGRSIATDRRLFPAPVVVYIEGALPLPGGGERRFARFALNQDTGGSIRGPGRVDLFLGAGDEAAEVAGRMQHSGRLYVLLPKGY
ncbi:MAG: MltA domain-containing protein [Acidobacteria bacterium]|nr:MltA domain-containing protein [Acidobacteriota bacterium]